MSGRRTSRATYRLGFVLALIALTPMVGATFFAVDRVLSARAQTESAASVAGAVDDLVALAELRAALTDESNWTGAAGGVAELGLDPDLVTKMTGFDTAASLQDARIRVDERIEELELTGLAIEVADLRSSSEIDLASKVSQLLGFEDRIAVLAEEQLSSLLVFASGVQDGGRLVERLRILERAAIARQATAAEFSDYFGARFDATETKSLIVDLSDDRNRRAWAISDIEKLALPGTHARAAVDAIVASPDVAALDTAATELIEGALDGNQTQGTLSAVLLDLDGTAELLKASTGNANLHSDLVSAAGRDVQEASLSVESSARSDHRSALVWLAGLMVASMVVAYAGRRIIARPVLKLAETARNIRDGNTEFEPAIEAGPVEIRIATRAINEAASQLALAEQQANALSAGDLDHPALDEEASGALGASLQTAVRTLASTIQERSRLQEQMAHDAAHDPLTQLPNRRASLEHLNGAIARTRRSDSQMAVTFIDLDGFKDVNDSFGHNAGDIVLQTVAERLGAELRSGDLAGRLGGDEFVLIAEHVSGVRGAEAFAKRLRDTLAEPIEIGSALINIGACFGIAIGGAETDDGAALLHEADVAVYRAKSMGRGNVVVYDDDLKSETIEREGVRTGLREALSFNELELYFHPMVDGSTHEVNGYEALVRWNRPGHGVVLPAGFLPIAERSDLIVAVDTWVAREAARQIVSWEARDEFHDLPISINVSARHLRSPDFVTNILGPLDELGVDPRRLVVELAEHAVLDDLEMAANKLHQLRRRGVRIALDDFGVGYTSLSHLKVLPIDVLKIDPSFVADEESQALLKLIIDTGRLLGAAVVAEGVETAEQASTLTALGCDALQGFLFGVPLPASELTAAPAIDASQA